MAGVEAACSLTHPSVKILASRGVAKFRKGMGFVASTVQQNLFFYNNSLSVMYRALMERLYYVKGNGEDGFVPCPLPTRPYHDLDSFKTSLLRNLPSLPPVWTNEQFVESYSGLKAKRYSAALNQLMRTGVRRSYGYLKTFIKGEFYNGTTKHNPCPRLIQPRSPVYNILIGRYLRPMEKLLYKAVDRVFGHHVVLKCDTPWKRAEVISRYWGEFQTPVFVGFDASRFDQHTSSAALSWEHSIYNSIARSDELAEYLTWQIDNVGYANTADGDVRYAVNGCRMSGDMNTALGNVLIMCGLCHHYLQPLGIRYRFIDDGDDCGVICEAADLHHLRGLPDHHLAYGYEMTVEAPVYRLEHIEFCQSRPVNLGNGNWMMVRNVHKALTQDALLIDKYDWVEIHNVLAATGICGLALYNGVPVLHEFYAMLARCQTDTRQVQHMLDEYRHGSRTWRSFSNPRMFDVDETTARVSLYHAFGILPDEQVALEQEFRAQNLQTQKQIHTRISNSALDRISYYLHHGEEVDD